LQNSDDQPEMHSPVAPAGGYSLGLIWPNQQQRSRMPNCSTSTFSEPEEFEAALRRQTNVDLLVTEQTDFRGRITQVGLHLLHLAVADETAPRIAFVAMRPDIVLVWWAIGRPGSQIWCGAPSSAGEVMTLGPGHRAHARTRGASRWAALWISATDLDRYSQTLTGTPVRALNGAGSWRPVGAALQTLHRLHAAAIAMFERRAGEVLAASAVHGLEQQLIHALVECLSDGVPGAHNRRTAERHDNLMARFEDACSPCEHRTSTLIELCATLGVPERSLRTSCMQHLGMGPMSYLRLRRLKSVRRALCSASPDDSSVAELARRYGFTELGRFAVKYRQVFGELPSATLQRVW
jgi:AraC-like DNA-binding protein